MSLEVIICSPQSETVLVVPVDDLAEAFDMIETMIGMGRHLVEGKNASRSVLGRMRDQVLLNFSRWLTDGKLSDRSREVFIQLCARKERSTTVTDIRLISAFGVADALTEALTNDTCWPDFDAKIKEFRALMEAA